MRTSTLVVLGILLVAFAILMWMANTSLNLYRPDVEAAQRVTRQAQARSEIAPDSRVKLRRVNDSAEHAGPGVNVEVTPAATVLARPGALSALVRRLALQVVQELPAEGAEALGWFKVTVHLPGGLDRVSVLERGPAGQLGPESPRLPATWPEGATPPAPPPPDPGSAAPPGPEPVRPPVPAPR